MNTPSIYSHPAMETLWWPYFTRVTVFQITSFLSHYFICSPVLFCPHLLTFEIASTVGSDDLNEYRIRLLSGDRDGMLFYRRSLRVEAEGK